MKHIKVQSNLLVYGYVQTRQLFISLIVQYSALYLWAHEDEVTLQISDDSHVSRLIKGGCYLRI